MSFLQNAPWTPSEKVDLLVNVLQSSFPDLPSFLLQIIHDHQVYPKWNDMPLPSGRSLHSSQIAFEEMSRLYRQQGRQPTQQMPMPYVPTPNLAPAIPQQRHYHEPEVYHASQRALQPRPPRSTDSPVPVVTNGEVSTIVRALAPEPSVQEVRKKRGRPSKEEAEERDRALAAEGKVYQPKKRPNKKARPSTGAHALEGVPSEPSHTPHTPRLRTIDDPPDEGSNKAVQFSQSHREVQGATKADAHDSAYGGPPSDSGSAAAQSPSDRLLANHRDRQTSRAATPQLTTPTAAKDEPKGL